MRHTMEKHLGRLDYGLDDGKRKGIQKVKFNLDK